MDNIKSVYNNKCKICSNEYDIQSLNNTFIQTDYNFCNGTISAEITDSIKWSIVDIINTMCKQHNNEYNKI